MPDASKDPTPGTSFTHTEGLQISGQLPLDVLPPEALERLKNGGDLSEAEMDAVRRAALADAGPSGLLVNALLDSGLMGRLTTQRNSSGAIVSEGERTFSWTPLSAPAELGEGGPQTYFELLTGRPDPNRGFFIGARTILNLISWAFAIGIPVLLIAVGVLSGESQETIFFMGVFGLIIAAMIRKSVPRLPFG